MLRQKSPSGYEVVSMWAPSGQMMVIKWLPSSTKQSTSGDNILGHSFQIRKATLAINYKDNMGEIRSPSKLEILHIGSCIAAMTHLLRSQEKSNTAIYGERGEGGA